MPAAIELARSCGGRIQLCIATAFTCPFDGPIGPDRVLQIVSDPRTAGADDNVLCDTLGQAIPSQVRSLVEDTVGLNQGRRTVFHGHDTWGLGAANTMAAIGSGADVVDGALGGLGRCPFAPGASGNTATEEILSPRGLDFSFRRRSHGWSGLPRHC